MPRHRAQTGSSESKVASQKAAAVETNCVNSSTANKQGYVKPTSTTDPSFSAAAIKEQIERVLRVNSIRKSIASAIKIDGKAGISDRLDIRDTVHFAICATIVQDFPHKPLWKKWIEETGGDVDISIGKSEAGTESTGATSINIKHLQNSTFMQRNQRAYNPNGCVPKHCRSHIVQTGMMFELFELCSRFLM
jgi:hypothetical protein